MSIYKLMTSKRFEFVGILIVAVVAMISIATIPLSSNKIGGIISNYAQAQKEVKVSIVPGASTLGDKAFSPNPVNIKVGDTVTWVNDDTYKSRSTSLFVRSEAREPGEEERNYSYSYCLTTGTMLAFIVIFSIID